MAQPTDILAHIRATAEAVALLSRNPEINHAAVNDFCNWVEQIAASHNLIVNTKVQLKKVKKDG